MVWRSGGTVQYRTGAGGAGQYSIGLVQEGQGGAGQYNTGLVQEGQGSTGQVRRCSTIQDRCRRGRAGPGGAVQYRIGQEGQYNTGQVQETISLTLTVYLDRQVH